MYTRKFGTLFTTALLIVGCSPSRDCAGRLDLVTNDSFVLKTTFQPDIEASQTEIGCDPSGDFCFRRFVFGDFSEEEVAGVVDGLERDLSDLAPEHIRRIEFESIILEPANNGRVQPVDARFGDEIERGVVLWLSSGSAPDRYTVRIEETARCSAE